MSMWWSLQLRREAASVPLARRLLVGAMETAGVDPDIAYELSVALSEACANAVEHGTVGRAGVGKGAGAGTHGAPEAYDPCDAYGGYDTCDTYGALGTCEPYDVYNACDAYGAQDAYWVTAYLDGDMCRIEVADTGPGFRQGIGSGGVRPADPSADAESGRGLFLIESLADHVSFHDRSASGGAVVSFDKTLKWQADRGAARPLLKVS